MPLFGGGVGGGGKGFVLLENRFVCFMNIFSHSAANKSKLEIQVGEENSRRHAGHHLQGSAFDYIKNLLNHDQI